MGTWVIFKIFKKFQNYQDGENYVREELEAQRLGSFRRSSGSTSSADRRFFSLFDWCYILRWTRFCGIQTLNFSLNISVPEAKMGCRDQVSRWQPPKWETPFLEILHFCISPFLIGGRQLLVGCKRTASEWPGWPSPWWPGWPRWSSPWWPGWPRPCYIQYPSSQPPAY